MEDVTTTNALVGTASEDRDQVDSKTLNDSSKPKDESESAAMILSSRKYS
jgi:hypothetical protein